MLIAFVLLGRNLEQRAKLKASSDMAGLLNILPTKARLIVDHDTEQSSSFVEVQCSNLSIGDQIVVFPGVSKFLSLFFFAKGKFCFSLRNNKSKQLVK